MSKDNPQALLDRYASEAGLQPQLEAWSKQGTLAERLAARPFLMAPMAGVSDAAWRIMARAGGASLAYTEMVSVAGIHFGGEKTWELVIPNATEPDIAVQLFGSKPEQFQEAAEQVFLRLGTRLALIDINMACPVPKVVRKGEGSALMNDPAQATTIVHATRAGIEAASQQLSLAPVPITCKIRRGYRMGEETAPTFAQILEEAGAQALAIHGRFAEQLYRGEADWGAIARVHSQVSIPVIASGDISTAQAATHVLDQTGAAAVMVARGSYGNPWIFSDAQTLYTGESNPQVPNSNPHPNPHPQAQRIAAFKLHLRLMDSVGTHIARARSLAGWYFRGIPNASYWRDQAMRATTLDDFLALADTIGED